MLGEFINCRENALRGRRSLRDLYTGFAASLPMVGIEISLRPAGAADRRDTPVTK